MTFDDFKPGTVYEDTGYDKVHRVWLVLEVLEYDHDSITVREVELFGKRPGHITSGVGIPRVLLAYYRVLFEGV